jgi:hypothetical protein
LGNNKREQSIYLSISKEYGNCCSQGYRGLLKRTGENNISHRRRRWAAAAAANGTIDNKKRWRRGKNKRRTGLEFGERKRSTQTTIGRYFL